EKVQTDFFKQLYNSDYYEGEVFPANPALAARDRITRAPKAFGFIDLTPEIKLTKAGELLLSEKRLDETFTRQLLKFQLPSPYHTQSRIVEFNVRPYLELLRLIREVDSLSKTEIALFFSQIININKFDTVVNKIKSFRKNAKRYKGSRKTYINECFKIEIGEIYNSEFTDKAFKTRESSDLSLKNFIKTKTANMKDYADAFVRYLRATELVTFQKKTFRLVISPQKIDEVDYILENTPRDAIKFESVSGFKSYMFNPFELSLLSDDKELLIAKIKNLGISEIDNTADIESLKDFYEDLKDRIKTENIDRKKKELKDFKELPDILDVFDKIRKKDVPDAALFLEWNVWRALVMLNYAKRVDGNFIMDIDGMPLSFAPGNQPDIESDFDDFGIITEVTMSSGNTQYNMESESVPRHYGKAKELFMKEVYCLFVAPKISEGTLAHYFNLNRINTRLYGGKTKIIPLSIEQFIDFVRVGVEKNFNNPEVLKNWLEQQWVYNQTCDDEQKWQEFIQISIPEWAS
ncbi:MAG: AlwI family type II restriction endonuclease, partial [Campylobacterales bacterium]